MSILRLSSELELAAHKARLARKLAEAKLKPGIAGEANAQECPEPASDGPGTGDKVAAAPPAHLKYQNRPTGGYSSAKEARRAAELKLMEKAGQIRNLREQVKFVLIPAQYDGKKLVERACKYVCDFAFEQVDGHGFEEPPIWREIIMDVKGYKKGAAYALFVVKRKLMLKVHGICVTET